MVNFLLVIKTKLKMKDRLSLLIKSTEITIEITKNVLLLR